METSSEETIFVESGEMRFEVSTAGDPQSDRLALMLHGFPELNYSWRYQMPLLADLGYRVWAPNQRGYGKTTRPPHRADYSIQNLVDDVGLLIDASGCKSVTLLAHDWGGAVAWMFALTQARPLERLVVMNLPHPTLFARSLRTWAQFKKSWYAMFFQIPRLPEAALRSRNGRIIADMFREMAIDKSRFPDEVTDVYRKHALEPGALTAMINWYRAVGRQTPEMRALITDPPTIEIPTLLIWGEEDIALGKELTYGTEQFVRDLTLRYLPQVSHWVQQEAPETVNAMLEAWLCGREVPEAGSVAAAARGA